MREMLPSICVCSFPVRKHASTMAAWQIYQYGNSSQLTLSQTVKQPTIVNPNNVLVKVHSASVNPIDVMMMGGYGSKTLNAKRMASRFVKRDGCDFSEFPMTLGRDFSGVVVEVGQNISHLKVGDEVWGAVDPIHQGTHAEYVLVASTEMSLKPKTLSHTEASTMPYVAATTWAALCTAGRLSPHNFRHKRVLILGGSGGLGTFAIQLCKSWEAEVTTTCAGDALETVLSLGADVAIDYKTHNVSRELQQLQGFDVILDAVGADSSEVLPLLRTNAASKYITVVHPFLRNSDQLGFPLGLVKSAFSLGTNAIKGLSQGRQYMWAIFRPNSEAMNKVAKLVDEGKIMPVLERAYPHSNLPEAFEKVGQKHGRGKTVISFV